MASRPVYRVGPKIVAGRTVATKAQLAELRTMRKELGIDFTSHKEASAAHSKFPEQVQPLLEVYALHY